jgi:hypothetical protein
MPAPPTTYINQQKCLIISLNLAQFCLEWIDGNCPAEIARASLDGGIESAANVRVLGYELPHCKLVGAVEDGVRFFVEIWFLSLAV